MITVTQESALLLSGTSRLICLESLRRGWVVRTPYLMSPHFFINKHDGHEVHIFSATPPTVSYASAQLANNKYATSVVLKEAGIVQLPIMLLDEVQEQPDEAVRFVQTHGRVVVKPIDGGHGKGITVGVVSKDELVRSYHYALVHTQTTQSVIVQKQLVAEELHDIRIAVIDGKVVGAIERIPARVKGDGIHTIAELIEYENQQEHRGEPYKAMLAQIDMERAKAYLGETIHDVLAVDEWRSVIALANYGMGGELLDVTDDIPSWMRDESIKAAEVLGLDVAGVDYLVNSSVRTDMGQEESQGVITEVNKCPSLLMHDEPTVGKNRHAVKAYVDFIASL